MQRVLFYVSGTAGLGHLSRAVTLGAALREVEPETQVMLLTEAATTQIAQEAGLSCVSLASLAPYLNRFPRARLASLRPKYRLALWEQVVGGVFAAFQPTIVIHDTYALEPIKKLAMACTALQVGVLRQSESMSTSLEQLIRDLDMIIIPHAEDEWGLTRFPPEYASRLDYSGYLVRRTPSELSPAALRARYTLEASDFLVVATNGGGDQPWKTPAGEARQFDHFPEAIIAATQLLRESLPAGRRLVLLLLTGPQASQEYAAFSYDSGSVRFVIHSYEPLLPDLMAAAQLVICRGGYNTIGEVLAIGVPTLAIPVLGIFDDQERRIAWAATQSPALQAGSLDPKVLAARIQQIMEQTPWVFPTVAQEQDQSFQRKRALAQRIFRRQRAARTWPLEEKRLSHE